MPVGFITGIALPEWIDQAALRNFDLLNLRIDSFSQYRRKVENEFFFQHLVSAS